MEELETPPLPEAPEENAAATEPSGTGISPEARIVEAAVASGNGETAAEEAPDAPKDGAAVADVEGAEAGPFEAPAEAGAAPQAASEETVRPLAETEGTGADAVPPEAAATAPSESLVEGGGAPAPAATLEAAGEAAVKPPAETESTEADSAPPIAAAVGPSEAAAEEGGAPEAASGELVTPLAETESTEGDSAPAEASAVGPSEAAAEEEGAPEAARGEPVTPLAETESTEADSAVAEASAAGPSETPAEPGGALEPANVPEAADVEPAKLVAEAEGTQPDSALAEGPLPVEAVQTSMEELLAETPPAASDMEDARLRAVLEAIIYVAEEPLTLAQLAAALREPAERIRKILEQLAAEYDKPEHGITVREVAGGYKMATKPEHHEGVRSFVKSLKPPLKLSLPALETLAVIAYKQPVTAPEIMEIRGVQGAGVLKTLLDRKLIAVAGRKNVIGKPILYKTTKEFLIQFGLKDLSELPSLKEFEEIRRMALSEGDVPAAEPAAQPAPAAVEPAAPAPPAAEAVESAPDAAAEPSGPQEP